MTLGESNPVSLWYTRPNMVTEACVALHVGQGRTASLGELVMSAWFEDEAFWMALYLYLFPEEQFALAEAHVDQLLALVAPAGHVVLDLCCGPGRHAIGLAKRGFAVTGVDLSAFLLAKAQARAQAAQVAVEWLRDDMRHFVRPEAYNLAVSLGTSFGYFADPQDDHRVLQNIFRSLKPHGVYLIDMLGKEVLAKTFQPTTSSQEPDGTLWIRRNEIVNGWSRIRTEWILIQGDKATTFHFQLTLYSGYELKERLEQAGFGTVRLFGDLQGNAYGPEASRLIAVAWKAP
jgi:SAM-dependent methyltransferase